MGFGKLGPIQGHAAVATCRPSGSRLIVSVIVANGAKMVTHEICRAVKWETQALQQSTDFLVLPLMGCDVVLCVHWLKQLGPIMWDFNALTMQFAIQGKWFTLHGMVFGKM